MHRVWENIKAYLALFSALLFAIILWCFMKICIYLDWRRKTQ